MMDARTVSRILAATEFATRHHGDQRYGDQPYMVHPLAVASFVVVKGGSLHQVLAAILHDVVEDTPATVDDVRRAFGPEVARIVDAVTKRPGQTAEEYLAGITGDAVLVKYCDSWCNSQALDEEEMGPERFARLSTKYARNLDVLGRRLQDLAPTLPFTPPAVPLIPDPAMAFPTLYGAHLDEPRRPVLWEPDDPRQAITGPEVTIRRRGLRWSWRTTAPYGSVYLEQSGTARTRRRAEAAASSAAGDLRGLRSDLRFQDRNARP